MQSVGSKFVFRNGRWWEFEREKEGDGWWYGSRLHIGGGVDRVPEAGIRCAPFPAYLSLHCSLSFVICLSLELKLYSQTHQNTFMKKIYMINNTNES